MPVTPDGTAYTLHENAGRPVLALIHGLGLNQHVWDGLLPALCEDYTVLTYDLYGHGLSKLPMQMASLSVYADQLARLMARLGLSEASIVGFSIGGMINRRFAMDHADRVSSLVILNSPHNRGEEAQAAVELRAKSVREEGASSTMEAALERWFTSEYLASDGSADRVRKWRMQADPESYAQAAWVLAYGVRELIEPAQAIDKPTLVMTCENDSGSTPKMSEDIAAEITGSECVIVPRLKHLGLMEEPNVFTNPILGFLKRTLA